MSALSGEAPARAPATADLGRVPRHVGIIPDGNRRWAQARGLKSHEGYPRGVERVIAVYEHARELGIGEISVYGCSEENLRKRPAIEADHIQAAVMDLVERLAGRGRPPQVIGNTASPVFHDDRLRALLPYCAPPSLPPGVTKMNLLLNYSWCWDLDVLLRRGASGEATSTANALGSRDVSEIDLVVRSSGRHRLSGFLPFQTAYADVYVVKDMWPDFSLDHLDEAIGWYQAVTVNRGA